MIPEEVAILAEAIMAVTGAARGNAIDLASKLVNELDLHNWYLTLRNDPE